MAVPTDRESLLRKIRALQDMVNFGTEAEALNAAEKISAMLDKYQLSLTDAELIDPEGMVEQDVDTGRKTYSSAMNYAVPAIALFCDCKVWCTKKFRGGKGMLSVFVFFGRAQDVEVAYYLYTIIQNALAKELKAFKKSDYYMWDLQGDQGARRKASNSFQRAMAIRVSDRLRTMRHERNEAAKSETGRNLMVVKMTAVEDAFRKKGLNLTNSNQSYRGDGNAFAAGRQAGDRVSLNPGLSSGLSSGPKALTA